mgnify:CR=1 FL=1
MSQYTKMFAAHKAFQSKKLVVKLIFKKYIQTLQAEYLPALMSMHENLVLSIVTCLDHCLDDYDPAANLFPKLL